MQGTLALPAVVWSEVASLCDDCPGPELRAQVVSCTHISVGFIDTQVWRRVREWPWRLAVGDVAANVTALATLDEPPHESVARKVWALSKQGFSRAQLVAGITLLTHLGWSSATVEQQHGNPRAPPA